jgi:hypothetical protein
MTHAFRSQRVTLAVLVAGMTQFCQGAIVQFTIDPDHTQVTLSGTAAGLTVVEQGPGSLTTSFEGTVMAEVTEDSLRFVGGGRIDGVPNGDWSPRALGVAGTEPADFGAQASGGLISGTAALRELLLDLESDGAMAVNEGEFSADGLLFLFPEDSPSAFDYRVTVFISTQSDRAFLAGYATNRIAATGTLTAQGNTQVLELPIQASIVFELLTPEDSTLTITGRLRATRAIEVAPDIVIRTFRLNEGILTFEWEGAADEVVHIESTADLVNWTRIEDIPAGMGSWSIEAAAGVEFFRVVKR